MTGQREFEARFQELSQKRGLSDYLRSYLRLMTVVARMGSLYGMTGEERSTHIASLQPELDALGAEIPTEEGLGGLRGAWWEARGSLAEFVGPEAVTAEREACYKELPKRRTMARRGE